MGQLVSNDILKLIIENVPESWVADTTHRLDIYKEELAKTEFLQELEKLVSSNSISKTSLFELPTAFDYIRLGHPLSCVLEWAYASRLGLEADNIISFASRMMPLLAILRKNLLDKKATRVLYTGQLPECFNADTLAKVYAYNIELVKINDVNHIGSFDGTQVLLTSFDNGLDITLNEHIDFTIALRSKIGSIVFVADSSKSYISEIQHVRRRESIAMTPFNCLQLLESSSGKTPRETTENVGQAFEKATQQVLEITHGNSLVPVSNCGLSIQYAITMGLIHHAMDNYSGKSIKLIVPPNCYGGTNDQARRVAACLDNVEVLDLPVDAGQNMVQSVENVLTHVASLDAVPLIIAEIPTNPRVEVPELEALAQALSKTRTTPSGETAIAPVFILDQTFCPNYQFLGDGDVLSKVKTISYVSGSKFPSGGRVTSGYCVGNTAAKELLPFVNDHLILNDNVATEQQVSIMSQTLPSMLTRIQQAYNNTREFVEHIRATLPESKINFVSHELAEDGFTPSVFSLDLPTKGDTAEEKEAYKRKLNHELIALMIKEIPTECKHCVSYGQEKGSYWTIPATSTQGTTKEGDKDYIVRVSMGPELNVVAHKEAFTKFCELHT